jgi:tetratricopeptide (TPR) repeat protein
MTTKRDLKSITRERQRKTGESYTAARVHVMRERAHRLGIPEESSLLAPHASEAPAPVAPATEPLALGTPAAEPLALEVPAARPQARVEAVVLKVGTMSTARIRIQGEAEQVTLRSRDVFALAPGQMIALRIEKRWKHRGDAYASGAVERAWIDVNQLGLAPLPLAIEDLVDLRDHYEHVRDPAPYAPLWRTLTAKPRRWCEMDGITWGAFPDDDRDGSPTSDASEMAAAGDLDGARELVMDTLLRDLRCLDAHAHLGMQLFDHSPARALAHYEIGMRIGELSLPDGFDGVLPWSCLYNRPFLRCLHGYALCLWRLGRTDEAIGVFERILAFNPNDNQGARFCWYDARQGKTWEQMQAQERAEAAARAEAVRKVRAAGPRRVSRDPGPRTN